MLVAVVCLVAVLYFFYSWYTKRPKNFPPGPPCLPVVGCAPFMDGNNFQFQMEGWRSKYGPAVGLVLGSAPMVAVVEAQAVLEVMKAEQCQGRPIIASVMDQTGGERLGVFFTDGPYWSEQRRFTLRHLRDFGFGKKSMESSIIAEVQDLLEELLKDNPKTIQVSMLFTVSVINVLWAIMSGSRYQRGDAQFQVLLEKLNNSFRSGNPSGASLENLIPSIRFYLPSWKKAMENRAHLQNFIMASVKEHKQTLDEANPRDFIDVYLTEMQQSPADSTFTEKSLVAIAMDLFSAGAESVSNSIGFCVLYMVLYPDVQKKVQKELDSIVGRSRSPSIDDKASLVYTEATILEVMRVNSIAPINVPRRVTQNFTFRGYDIPRGTTLLINLWSCMNDKQHWGDPQNFRPERFIGADGHVIKDEYMATFGGGRRVCLGEPLARNILFLFFASLLQELTFSLPPGAEKPSTIPLSGFTVAPQPFQVTVQQRR